MTRFRFTKRAARDLCEISLYTRKQWGADQERRYREQIELELRRLTLNANMGRLRAELGPEVRSVRIASHVAFYVPDRDGLTVIRLLHPSQDIELAFDLAAQKSFVNDREQRAPFTAMR